MFAHACQVLADDTVGGMHGTWVDLGLLIKADEHLAMCRGGPGHPVLGDPRGQRCREWSSTILGELLQLLSCNQRHRCKTPEQNGTVFHPWPTGGLQRVPWHDLVDSLQEQFLKGFCPKDSVNWIEGELQLTCKVNPIIPIYTLFVSTFLLHMMLYVIHMGTIDLHINVSALHFGIICLKHTKGMLGCKAGQDLLESLRQRVAKKSCHHASWVSSWPAVEPTFFALLIASPFKFRIWHAKSFWLHISTSHHRAEVTRQHWEELLETYDHSITDLLDVLLEEAF